MPSEGAEAEVDFGEFYATIARARVKAWMFVMRLSHSGKAFHVAFATQAQEAFLGSSRWSQHLIRWRGVDDGEVLQPDGARVVSGVLGCAAGG